ncbi:MAG: polysaccharide deacetylase family protein [Actinomycetota bacterium]
MRRRSFLSALALGSVGWVGASRGLPAQTSDPEVEPSRLDGPTGGTRHVMWSVPTEVPRAALTFDDGPDPEFTPAILDALAGAGVKATFMVMGHNAIRHPNLLRRVVADGHELGNHTWSHLDLSTLTPAEVLDEVSRGSEAIEDVVGIQPTLFRPPKGIISEAALQAAAMSGQDIVVWSVTRGGLGLDRAARIAEAVDAAVGPGDIVDLHDGIGRGTFNPEADFTQRIKARRRIEVQALPMILERAAARGMALGTVSELVSAAGGHPCDAGTK